MSPPPAQPAIFHITHVDNLPAIIASGGLWSDALIAAKGGPASTIGMSKIKQRRLALPVGVHPGLHVGDFVPFYFCPRSIMLFVIHCQNHPDLAYTGGQRPIVHLVAELHAVVAWATAQQRAWAFSLGNAAATYAEFRNRLVDLGEIDWTSVAATDFRPSPIKEAKLSRQSFYCMAAFPGDWSRRSAYTRLRSPRRSRRRLRTRITARRWRSSRTGTTRRAPWR